MFIITPEIAIKNTELEFSFIRSPKPGGQNVNKVSTAVQLRFNVAKSTSLTDTVKARLIKQLTSRLTTEGEIIIKASSYRTQLQNKEDALARLAALIKKAAHVPKKRKKTKPSKATKQKRLNTKKQHSQKKAGRKKRDHLD